MKLLYKAEYVAENDVIYLINGCKEIQQILVSTLKTAKQNKEL